MNPLHAIEGFVNKALSGTPLADEEVEQLSTLRMDICRACLKDESTPCLSSEEKCCKCNCWMPAKTRSLDEKCPINKW